MTQDELDALVTILQRAPMTPAEALWVQGIITAEAQRIRAAKPQLQPDATEELNNEQR